MALPTQDMMTAMPKSIINKSQVNVNKSFVPKLTTIGKVGGIYCHICELTFSHKKEFTDHYKIHGDKELIYTCVVCHKQVKVYSSFRAHCYSVHVVGNKNRCHHCYKAFSKYESLEEHIKANHSQTSIQCSVCHKKFTSEKELQLHQIIHNSKDSPPYNCKICKIFLPTLDHCKSHAEVHTLLIYHCPICNENINKQNATEHLKKHFDNNSHNEGTTEVNTNSDEDATDNIKDKNTMEEDDLDIAETSVEQFGIACDFCSDLFKNKVEFDDHFPEEHGELSTEDLLYVCVVCNKKFNRYKGFASHVYNHAVKAKFRCNVCHKRFGRLSMLATHMALCRAGADSSKPFACSECGHRYGLEGSLRKHLRDQHGIHCVRCPVLNCGRTFPTMKELVVHQYQHKSEEAWCRRCGMLFTSLAACEQHLHVHRQTLHSCPVCSRDYPDRNHLMNHIMQHFESLILLCKICGKVFNQRRRFLYHMETHSDKQTHICSYCTKSFRTPAQLRVHLNTHTGSKPYKCAVCQKAFGNYANLSKHKRRMHMKLNSVTPNNLDPTSDDDEIYSDELVTSDDIGKNNLNTPKIDDKPAGSTQRKRPKKIVSENKVAENKGHSTFDVSVENDLESIDDDELLSSEAINNYNNLNTPEYGNKLAGSNQRKRPKKIVPENKDSRKLHLTSDAKPEIDSRNFEEDTFTTNNANLKETKNEKVKILDIQHVYYPIQNNMVKQKDHIDIEPEPIDPIDLEKELQLLENISKSGDNKDAVYGDVLSTGSTDFDYVGIEELPTAGSSEQTNYPQEYGPEFAVQDCGILNLDDHMLPHIDPLLTIKTVDYGTHNNGLLPPIFDTSTYQEYQTPIWEPPIFTKVAPDYNYNGNSTYQEYQAPGWEPPIFTKVCPEYTYYGDMVDSNRTSMMNTDIF